MSVKVRVWGDYALFTRPEMKVERVSYDVMTPSAARGLMESVYWHPGLKWVIDRICVCRPIRFMNLRRNEVKEVASAAKARQIMTSEKGEMYISAQEQIQQRASMLLRDVEYIIEAHFDMTPRAAASDNPGKFQDIVKRRLIRGQFYHQPCFGCREFPAQFALCEEPFVCPEELKGTRELGFMLWDIDYGDPEDPRPMFFRAVLEDGVLQVPPPGSEEVHG